MSEPQGALNPEPANPQDRAEHDLPPKSYADAAQEATEEGSAENEHPYGHSNGSTSKENGSAEKPAAVTVNAGRKQPDKRVVFERYSNGNGSVLTSVRPDPDYEESLKHDQKVAPRKRADSSKSKRQDIPKSQLKSGRKAGAGWQQSAYVNFIPKTYPLSLIMLEFVGLLSMFLSSDASKRWLFFGIPLPSLCFFLSSFSLHQFHYFGHYLSHT